jgi:sugar phosphate isomerase/epimerase
MHLGIGSYTFAWAIGVPGHPPPAPMNAFGLLGEAKRLGVGVVQFCDNLPFTALTSAELDRFQLEASSAGVAIELGTRGLDYDNLRAHLSLCRRLGSPFLRLVVDSPGDEPSPDQVLARLKPLLPEFAAAGVGLALENHDRFSSRTLAALVRAMGIDQVGICLDTVNSFGALEGPEVVTEVLGELIFCLHVKDFTIRRVSHNMGFVIEGCAAGQGRLNIPWLLKRLKRCSNPFNAILETWVTPGNSLEETVARERAWADEGIRYLRTLIPD